MNLRHLWAFLWLRWRIRVNRFKRSGTANMIILAILAPFVILLPFALFAGMLFIGYQLVPLPKVPPIVVVLIWDVLVLAFLFWWCMGLITELQRSDSLALTKFLHLPVSLKGVFLINYLGSLFNLTFLMFLPAMAGLALGMILSHGSKMAIMALLIPAFFLMVTALTYQFQGWLASLMVNKHRRRTIIVMITMGFVLVAQLPNLLQIVPNWQEKDEHSEIARIRSKRDELRRQFEEEKITEDVFDERMGDLRREQDEINAAWERQMVDQFSPVVWIVNAVLPIGWLPLGAWEAAEGNVIPGLLGTLGMTGLGLLSLRRSYRTTLMLYTGQFTSGKGKSVAGLAEESRPPSEVKPATGPAQPAVFMERRIPWLSEQTTAIVLGTLRSLMRAPEAKMMLLSPLIMVLVFGGMVLTRTGDIPQRFRPPLAFGGIGMVLFGMVSIMCNQFGFDRNGFRVYVLCAAPRRDVLLGKNLAFLPIVMILTVVSVGIIQFVQPMRWDDLLAMAFVCVSMYLVFCLMGNFVSIVAPMALAAGTFKPAQPKLIPILLQLLFVLLMPILLGPLLLPLGIQLLLEWREIATGWPIFLALAVVECGVVVLIYWLLLKAQGSLLHAREQRILEVVMTKAE